MSHSTRFKPSRSPLSRRLADLHTGIPYFEAHVAIERHIASSRRPATILRSAIFMEDLVETKYAPPMWWGTVRRTVGADKKLNWVAVDDLGAIVARVFADPDAYIGRDITVAGDYRSIGEAGEIFKRVTDKPWSAGCERARAHARNRSRKRSTNYSCRAVNS